MKGILCWLLIFASHPLCADSLWWKVSTEPGLSRVKRADPGSLEAGTLRALLETLRALPEESLPAILGKPRIIAGGTIPFPKGFTVPATSRHVFGNSIYQPKFITTHLHALGDSFLVAFIYWGEDEELAKRTRSVEVGFHWDDPYGVPYRKLSERDLAIWEIIRGAEFLRAIVRSDPYRQSRKPQPATDPFR